MPAARAADRETGESQERRSLSAASFMAYIPDEMKSGAAAIRRDRQTPGFVRAPPAPSVRKKLSADAVIALSVLIGLGRRAEPEPLEASKKWRSAADLRLR